MFETIYTLLTRLETSEDATWYEHDGHFDVTLEDFAGFTADWEEIDRPYADPEMVEAFFEVLDTADSTDEDFYCTYYFTDCSVCLGFASYDI